MALKKSEVLPYELSGNESSAELVVFLHGWPDQSSMWSAVVRELQSDFRLLNITYPNFSARETQLLG